ncbi:MAG: ATP-binding cassette domain-containing protein [Mariniblastus sp.]|nr:ATP-binding cassette domain-containing protein [Mariniblastus sp.]
MITVVNLVKRFPSRTQDVIAVDHLTFRVEPGEVYGLLGPNGAGKTTTLRMILGLLVPSGGMAEIAEYRVTENPDEVKRRIGYASASVGVYPWLTPKEMLLFSADLYNVKPTVANRRLEELTDLLDLATFIHQRCATLSTGQKQRVNLARALMHDPPVMLMDEPTLGLDIVASKVVFDYIGHLREQKKAVIVCTHRLEEAQRLCDRFGLLHEGKLRHEGSLAELQSATGQQDLTDMFLDLLAQDLNGTTGPSGSQVGRDA